MELNITQGHTQAEVLDAISEAIRKLKQIEETLTGEEPGWEHYIEDGKRLPKK